MTIPRMTGIDELYEGEPPHPAEREIDGLITCHQAAQGWGPVSEAALLIDFLDLEYPTGEEAR